MKKWLAIPVLAAAICLSLTGCGTTESSDSGENVFPFSTYDDTLPVLMGDVMPFYDDGVMNIYHLRDSKGTNSLFYHPIARLTTTDFVHYVDEGVSIDFVEDVNSVDAALGTGSFIKDKDGNYHCFYTGHNDDVKGDIKDRSEEMPYRECIRHAVSFDNQKTWIKRDNFIKYGGTDDFRDPYVYYSSSEDCYYMLVTARFDNHGIIQQYRADSLDASADEWVFNGDFLWNDDGDYNMECPSYIEYNGYEYLAYSEQGANRVTHYRYRKSGESEWKKGTIDNTGFYAGRLEKAGDKLYAFAWCAKLAGGSTGGFDWAGNLVTHELLQNPATGELLAVMVSNVKEAFSDKVTYKTGNGKKVSDFSFDGEKFTSYSLEALSGNITRMHFTIEITKTIDITKDNNDFGMTFGLDGAYNNRLGSAVIAFDAKQSQLIAYNEVSSILRYNDPLARVGFAYVIGRQYNVDLIIERDILTVYLDSTVALTARLSNIEKANFAFYSNGVAAKIKGVTFYE